MKITLPENRRDNHHGKVPGAFNFLLFLALVVLETALLIMIALGMQMSASPLAAITGGAFLLVLFGIIR